MVFCLATDVVDMLCAKIDALVLEWNAYKHALVAKRTTAFHSAAVVSCHLPVLCLGGFRPVKT